MPTKKIGAWGMLLLAVFLFSTGCNTLEGAGEDIQDAGEEMEDAAN
ncbi:entericidin A/B family lipoprotein [Nitrospira sp. M1]